jgi:hypothetical protein
MLPRFRCEKDHLWNMGRHRRRLSSEQPERGAIFRHIFGNLLHGMTRGPKTLGSRLVAVRIVLLMISAGIWTWAFCQDSRPAGGGSKEMAAPTLPFYDWGACPYETCGYRQWTAHRSVTVYNTWKQGRRPIAQLAAGGKVTGVTGVVITVVPGRIRMDRDLPDADLRRGDIVLTYAFRGEGFSAVWFKGRYYSDFDISFTRWPDGTGCGGAHCAATYMDLGGKSWWAR